MDNIRKDTEKCPFYDSCNHIDCDTFCLKRYKSNHYFELGFIPENKRCKLPLRVDSDGRDIEAFNTLSDVEKNIDDFVHKGSNLYIYSSIAGNGKTSWAFRLLRAYVNKV